MTYLKNNISLIFIVFSFFVASVPACGQKTDSPPNTNRAPNSDSAANSRPPPEHACNHAQNGPFVPSDQTALTSASDKSGKLPTIHHGEWTKIKLNPTKDTYGGFVKFKAKRSGGHRFFTSKRWPGENIRTYTNPYIRFPTGDLNFKAKHPVRSSRWCAQVNFNHSYGGFEAGTSYILQIEKHPSEVIFIVPVPGTSQSHK